MRGLIMYNSQYVPYFVSTEVVRVVLQELAEKGVTIDLNLWEFLATYNPETENVVTELVYDETPTLTAAIVPKYPPIKNIIKAELLGWREEKYITFEYLYPKYMNGNTDKLCRILDIDPQNIDQILEVMFL